MIRRRPTPPAATPPRRGGALALTALCLLVTGGAAAQPVAEVTAGIESLSDAYADGRSVEARVTVPHPRGYVQGTAGVLDRFDQGTLVLGAVVARSVGSRWVVTGSAGGSTAGVIAPRARAALGVGRRWTRAANVLTSLTVGLRDVRDGHRDLDVIAEAAVYGPTTVFQVGGRLSRSTPGPATSGRLFAAVVLADVGGAEVTARLEGGTEAWTVLVPEAPLDVAFRSGEASVSARRAVAGRWGVVVGAGLYANPYYTRVGLRTGLSRSF